MIGRLLCFLGLHRWHFHDEHLLTVTITYARCARPDCQRYHDDAIVNLERRREMLCSCRRYAFPSPLCLVHGREAA